MVVVAFGMICLLVVDRVVFIGSSHLCELRRFGLVRVFVDFLPKSVSGRPML